MNELINSCIGFQWDKGNSEKNWEKHKVTVTKDERKRKMALFLMYATHEDDLPQA